MKKYKLILGLLMFFSILSRVNADANVTLSCDNNVTLGKYFYCNLKYTSNTSNEYNKISGNINISMFELSSNDLNITNEYFNIESSGLSTSENYSIKLLAPTSLIGGKTYTIKLSNIKLYNEDDETSINNIETNVRIKSNENTLSSLYVSGTTISNEFSPTKTEYLASTTYSSITISATKTNANSIVSGLGNYNLSIGNNTFIIKVTAEDGSIKNYTININRINTKETINTLTSLSVKGYSLLPKFNSTNNEYNVTVDSNATKVKIEATKSGNKSIFVSGYGPREITLSGKTTVAIIKVKSEYGEENIYKINITKKDEIKTTTTKVDTRSKNNYLSNIQLDVVKLNFDKNKLIYELNSNYALNEVEVSATLEDEKSSFVDNYGPRKVKINDGKNEILIKVKSESQEIRTYKIIINKIDDRDKNNNLKDLKVSDGFLEFNNSLTNYEMKVSNEVRSINIEAITESEKAKVTIDGPKILMVGENIYNINVIAENTDTKTYVLKVIRSESTLSNNSNVKDIIISNYIFNFDPNTKQYDLTIKEKKLNINVILEDEKAKYNILGNELLKNGSTIKIMSFAEDGSHTDYTINIHKENNKLYCGIISAGVSFIELIIFIICYFKRKLEK